MLNRYCEGYVGVACVDGSCPIANAEEYEERCMDVVKNAVTVIIIVVVMIVRYMALNIVIKIEITPLYSSEQLDGE